MSHISTNFYAFDEDLPIVRVSIVVDPSHDEWIRFMDAIFADKRYKKGLGMLIDRRRAPVPETKDVRAIARYIDGKECEGETRGWALVVLDMGSYAMGCMAEQMTVHENSVRVFRNVQEALSWLSDRSHNPAKLRSRIN